jgi:hypothetical protein
MLGYYNADRAANGLPSVNVINPAMQQGCLNHDNYMALNHEMVHGEQPGKPGYTPQGNYRDGAGGGEVLAEDVSSGWTASYEPWRTAPIHLYLLFDPTVYQVGYANAYGLQCMRMRGPDTAPMTEPAPVLRLTTAAKITPTRITLTPHASRKHRWWFVVGCGTRARTRPIPRIRPLPSARRCRAAEPALEDPGQDQRADHDQDQRGEEVAPAVEPAGLQPVAAGGGEQRERHDGADRGGGEQGEGSEGGSDARGRGGEEHGQDRQVG